MNCSKKRLYPPLYHRLYSVWFRHMRVYTRHILSNGLPPFLEPLIFLAGIGLGLGTYITDTMDGLRYIEFLGTGLIVTSAMYTSSFECTFGTFIRLEFDKVYDGMLAAPITASNLIVGEMLWAASKGFFFSFAVMCILSVFRIIDLPAGLLTPFVGFLTGFMFAAVGLYITSFVKTINHFNFYMTGILSPMFFFSGVVFPISRLPAPLQIVSEAIPLTHAVRISRAVCVNSYNVSLLGDLAYIVFFTLILAILAVHRLKKRLIN